MRQLAIITDPANLPDLPEMPYLAYRKTAEKITPFTNAKTFLGREFPCAVYDMQHHKGVALHLEALAIIVGTIQQGGTLYLLCPLWQRLEKIIDWDSQRWNNQQPIPTPNFYRHFKGLIEAFGFALDPPITQLIPNTTPSSQTLTEDQQTIFQNLPLADEPIHLITAPRGRGKSTLAGKLAAEIAKTQSVLITARSHATLSHFWRSSALASIPFFAPDRLIQQIEQQTISPQQWLFIDEAASLPLPLLHRFCGYFDKVVLTTTTHNYEGTGRGFGLKFLPQLQRPYQVWQLHQPLRWRPNDPLEAFIDQLLLLADNTANVAKTLPACPILAEKKAFYILLAQAHYKTTPSDLRRLFDAEDQRFFQIKQQNRLIAGCWAVNEGGLDRELTQAIWQGTRRPAGNLVAQYLCFQGNLPEACTLRSVRISRIAVQPKWQGKGVGKRLVRELILQISTQTDPLVDFISVSFGISPELVRFWTSCDFQLVQITPTAEASSGYPSAMMLFPLSEQGKAFCSHAVGQFKRNQPETFDFHFSESDRQNLYGFIHHQRTLSACTASLKRLAHRYPHALQGLIPCIEQAKMPLLSNKSPNLSQIKQSLHSLHLLQEL